MSNTDEKIMSQMDVDTVDVELPSCGQRGCEALGHAHCRKDAMGEMLAHIAELNPQRPSQAVSDALAAVGVDVTAYPQPNGLKHPADMPRAAAPARPSIVQKAAQDTARTCARASATAVEIMLDVSRVIVGPQDAYKERLLAQALQRAYIMGAAFGSQLAIETIMQMEESE